MEKTFQVGGSRKLIVISTKVFFLPRPFPQSNVEKGQSSIKDKFFKELWL